MTASVPKLLVATEFPPGAAGGGPAVVRQMLNDWPKERLFWWSCLPEGEATDGRKVGEHRVTPIPVRLFPNARFTRAKSWLLERLWVQRAAQDLRVAIRELQPDAIWVIPHQWSIPVLAGAIPNSGVGFHVTMQDFADSQGYTARLGSARSRRFAEMADQLYTKSTTRDATSHPMIEELERLTSRTAAQMLHAGLEESDFAALSDAAQPAESIIRIAYAGTIVVDDVFATFIAALKELQRQGNHRFELQLFSSHSYRERPWFDPVWMKENGNLPETELSNRLRDCTWAFSPMDLTNDDPRYNRFSFPTKFITYLAAGLPIITLGHSQSSVVKMARQYRVGLCLDESATRNLPAELGAAFETSRPRSVFHHEIVRCGRQEFDATIMRQKLYECFATCAGGD